MKAPSREIAPVAAVVLGGLALAIPVALFVPREWGHDGILSGIIAVVAHTLLPALQRGSLAPAGALRRLLHATQPSTRLPRPERIAIAVVVLYAALFVANNLVRIARYELWYDHALFMDVAKRTVEGEPFASAFVGPNILSHHFMPVLFPISHLWGLFAGPHFFPVFHALSLAASAWLLYRWAERVLSDPWAALGVLFTYVLCTRVWMATVYFYYPEGLEPLLFFAALLFLERRQPVRAVACVVVLLSCKEDAVLLTAILAAYAVCRARLRRTAVAMGGLAVTAAVTFLVVLPSLLGHAAGAGFADRYGRWGATAGAVAWGLVSAPHEVVAHLLSGERLASILKIGFPLLWLPFRAGVWSLVLLAIGVHLVSAYPFQQRLGGHYFLLAAPIVWFTLVLALRRLEAARGSAALRRATVAAVVGTMAWNLLEPWTVYPRSRSPHDVAAIEKLLGSIPDGGQVAADPRFLPYLYARTRAVPRWSLGVEEIARGAVDFVAIDRGENVAEQAENAAAAERLRATGVFDTPVEEGGHVLLRYNRLRR